MWRDVADCVQHGKMLLSVSHNKNGGKMNVMLGTGALVPLLPPPHSSLEPGQRSKMWNSPLVVLLACLLLMVIC